MIKLSLIIPIYNVEKYIGVCLDSIYNANNLLGLFEVIIINDGTPDRSMEVVEKYSLKYDNIRIFSQENKGLGEARNVGIKKAKGEYIWCVDSDDWLSSAAINRVCKSLDNYKPEVLSLGIVYSTGEKPGVKNHAIDGKIYTGMEFLDINIVQNPAQCYIIKKSFYNQNNLTFIKGLYHEDSLFTPILLYWTKVLVHDSFPYYVYNVRENSIMTSGNNLRHCNDMIKIGIELNDFVNINLKKNQEKKIFFKYISISVGAIYYYWKQMNKIEKSIISKKIPFIMFFKPVILNLKFKYMAILIFLKLR